MNTVLRARGVALVVIYLTFCLGCAPAPVIVATQPPEPVESFEPTEFGARRLLQRAEQARRQAKRARREGDLETEVQALVEHQELCERALAAAKVEKKSPSLCYFLSEMASGEQLRGQREQAESHRLEAFSLASGSIQTRDMRERLFRFYQEGKEWDKARKFLVRVQAKEENALEKLLIRVHQAEVELRDGQPDLAVELSEAILDQGQRMAPRARTLRAMRAAYRIRGEIAASEGRNEEARFCLVEAEDLEKQARSASKIGMH